MITRSADYVEYCRENAARSKTLHDLALRGAGKEAITAAIHQRIVEDVHLGPGDDLVDIGCGEGRLLHMAAKLGVNSAVGFLATEEEVGLVKASGVDVRQAFSDQLPLPDACASAVVCNNVLLIVSREKIPPTLREIHRIAKPGARILIGEVPFVPGPPLEPQFETAGETLAYPTAAMDCALAWAWRAACSIGNSPANPWSSATARKSRSTPPLKNSSLLRAKSVSRPSDTGSTTSPARATITCSRRLPRSRRNLSFRIRL
jgi:SAM-dependent methyltransferase